MSYVGEFKQNRDVDLLGRMHSKNIMKMKKECKDKSPLAIELINHNISSYEYF